MQKTNLRLKDRSTMSKVEYLFSHTVYSVLLAFDLYELLPLAVPLAWYTNSIPRLAICMLATNLLGLLFSFWNNRREIGVAADVLAGMGLYTILTVGKYVASITRWLLVGMLVFSLVEILLVMCRKIGDKNRTKQVMLTRFLKCTQVLRKNAGITAVILIAAFTIKFHYFRDSQMDEAYAQKVNEASEAAQKENELSVNVVYGDQYRISENLDKIKWIASDEIFQTLDYDQKCEVLKAIIYCEARYLGLCGLNIEFVDMDRVYESDSVLGTYDHRTKTITINAKPVRDGTLPGGASWELLITVLHECRHCYQHLLVELYEDASPSQRNLLAFTDEDVKAWRENMANYIPGDGTSEGELAYKNQAIEKDAMKYAIESSQTYFRALNELLDEDALTE